MSSCAPRNIVLVGFMGAGKSTVGQLLAESLRMPLVDTDALVESRTGVSIARLFATQGERAFRTIEASVVQEVTQGRGQVIATGGGAVADASSLECMLAGNLVVWLTAPLDVLVERAQRQGQRPLLESAADLQQLFKERVQYYAQAHLAVSAEAAPERIAETIGAYWEMARRGGMRMRSVSVHVNDRTYPIHVGTDLLRRSHELIPLAPTRALLVTDSNVAPLYGERVLCSLRNGGWEIQQVVFPAGEERKTLETLGTLYEACVKADLSRDSAIIALGGGVSGDMAGLVAATYLRGVALIQIPTTFLSQVDASVGGKVAVNLDAGKNLVGTFYQPQVVIADVATLGSLHERQLLSGLAEVIKHGLIADVDLFQLLEERLPAILLRTPEELSHCVIRSCQIKGRIVEADEKETSARREVLNFGHTVGHALEAATGYVEYTHGEAVAVGMVTAARLSQVLAAFPAEQLKRLVALLRRAGLPVSASKVSVEELLLAARRDKKVRAGQLRMVLVPRIGEAAAGVVVTQGQLSEALEWQRQL